MHLSGFSFMLPSGPAHCSNTQICPRRSGYIWLTCSVCNGHARQPVKGPRSILLSLSLDSLSTWHDRSLFPSLPPPQISWGMWLFAPRGPGGMLATAVGTAASYRPTLLSAFSLINKAGHSRGTRVRTKPC